MSTKRDKKIELRVTEDEKVQIQKIADETGLDVSSLIRNAVLTDEKLILLPGGTDIAKGICQLMTEFSRAYKGNYIDSKYSSILLVSIEELVITINQLMEKLPDTSNGTE